MQDFKVNIPPSVMEEIEHYVDDIAGDSVPNALKWYREIVEKIKSLNRFPSRCSYADETVFHDFEIRNLIFGNYRILFHIEGQTVQVLHVKHGKMKRIPIDLPRIQ
ncbi:MAG: type II toxin-antitoxin system RelE/ParE family toxin [Rhodospirillales bacterium]|nr:type II toxin-antitoxin system RelE/ParE family toxin [Rhodospirillales bacterium]MCB9973154.1 type II toxin-antitoxin system RelE/ParE family toxin [Rhodospirillales bacterium]MCB9980146.1 type II toxin-antitoxin system RelE/ParE family toxin [Rhodospirillales bacterium]